MSKDQTLILDLRRMLYLFKLAEMNLEFLKSSDIFYGRYKANINNVLNSINRFRSDMKLLASSKAWEEADRELNGDQVKDLCVLLDTLMSIEDVCPIIEAIEIAKMPL
jgi:hypothetical protein